MTTWPSQAIASCTRSSAGAIGQRAVAEHQAGDVGGEKAAAVQRAWSTPKARRRARWSARAGGPAAAGRARRSSQRPARPMPKPPATPTASSSAISSARSPAERRALAVARGERDGQDDRDRIVEPRLELERRGDALATARCGRAQHREDGGGVGRRDDGAEEEALVPREAEEVRGDADERVVTSTPTVASTSRAPARGGRWRTTR